MSESDDVSRSFRQMPPAHYTLEIDSFSQLEKIVDSHTKCFESKIFEAGGYKWKLSLYPNGDHERNGEGHISLFLVIAETETLPLDWEVNVEFKFFVFDQIRDQYLMVQDGRVRRFHRLKKEWGFAQLLSYDTFHDSSNGYHIKDKCVFGAEIFVISKSRRGERLTPTTIKPNVLPYVWKIYQFSTLEDHHLSPVFSLADFKWQLELYPKGDSSVDENSLSLFLWRKDPETAPGVYVEFTLTIRNQLKNYVKSHKYNCWFTASSTGWGCHRLIPLIDVRDVSKGFLVNDAIVVEARIESFSTMQCFSRESGKIVYQLFS